MNYFKTIKELAELLEGYEELVKEYDNLIKEIHNISSENIVVEMIEEKYNIRLEDK